MAVVPLATLSTADHVDLVVRRLSREFAVGHRLIHRAELLTTQQEAVRAALRQAAAAYHAAVD